MTVATVLTVLGVWMALATVTTVLLTLAIRHGERQDRADLDAELRDLIEQDRT